MSLRPVTTHKDDTMITDPSTGAPILDAAGLATGEEHKGKTPKDHRKVHASNLFTEAAAEEKALEAQREHDNKISLLVGAKNYQRLRAFGYAVEYRGKDLAKTTTDRRSL